MLLLVIVSGSAEAVTLRDIASHPYNDSIQELVDRGIVHGYSDGNFKPDLPINRAEFLKILMLAVFGEEAFDVSSTACFFDFGVEIQWYYPHACTAKDLGIVGGYPDGTFRGESTVNLVEALKMSLEAWEVPIPQYPRISNKSGTVSRLRRDIRQDDDGTNALRRSVSETNHEAEWYDPYVDAAATTGVFRTIPLVPDFPLTRGEAAELLVRLGQPLKVLDPDFADTQLNTLSRRDLEDAIQDLITPDTVCGNGILEDGEACDDGNTENDDGCSEICIIVPQPIRHGALRIEQRPLGSISIALGAEDVPLIAFDAIAGRQDMFITQLKFSAGVGSLDSGRNYRLYYDRDGDGEAETNLGNAVPQSERLTYASLSIPVRDGFYTRVEIRSDIATSGTVNDFSLQFDTSEPDYIEGVGAEDGEDISGIETDNATCQLVSICWISVYTETPRFVSVGTQGSLFVTEDSSPVRSRQLLAGELSDVLLRFKLRATEEVIAVSKISISGGNESIDSLELYVAGASSPFVTARKTACNTVTSGHFCADTDLLVLRDTEMRIEVRARVNPDYSGATSGDTAILTLSASTTGNTAIEAWGDSSLMELNQNNGNATPEGEIIIGRDTPGANSVIQGETHDVVIAKLATIRDAHSDADNSPVPSGLSTFATFQFTAEPHANNFNGLNDIVITSIDFSVTANNVQFDSSSFELHNPSIPGFSATCSGGSTGNITVTCSGLDSSSISTVIAQGGTIKLALRGDITNTQVTSGTSTLQAQINGLGSRGSGPITWNDEVSTIQWVDLDVSTIRSTLYRTQ